ncbi:PREDICTED: CMP-N-acetylneuraminate-beta-galactosamide-alpha-2,3-sialyltransferase 4-like [Gekko japonicus]|uniref:CMP-N-acetylneuraminate-beta-galactosamide- alpha-2,3-sialyltransferase 4-like n=1 Tax=Gekko japonicus TaxID=146911 RepID=A0ABM1JJJ1_GEKJA|nr:PREDICTED: CMP-N-acetylneuraminate-beta-galactosamide-alpha-2,3-sialyltransferase 4-like [Gekko japonicus]
MPESAAVGRACLPVGCPAEVAPPLEGDAGAPGEDEAAAGAVEPPHASLSCVVGSGFGNNDDELGGLPNLPPATLTIVQIFHESLKMPPDGIYYEADSTVQEGPMAQLDIGRFLIGNLKLQRLRIKDGGFREDILRCKTCIVVGNGYTLRRQRLGKFIDSHDIIIRINDAPLKGYGKDVGKKTTFRFFFPESALSDPLENSDNDTVFILVPFKMLDLLWVKEVLQNKKEEILTGFWRQPPMEWKGKATHLRIMNPYVTFEATFRFLQLDMWPRRYSTTGLIAVIFALHLCQEVNIVGFGYPPEKNRTSPLHYYGMDHLTKNMIRTHNLTAEQKWLLKMQEREMIFDVLRPPTSWVWGPRPQW